MPIPDTPFRAVVFDYGNTLIHFGREQLEAYDAVLSAGLETHFGAFDRKVFNEFRMASRLAPYQGDPPEFRENDFAAITADLVRALYGRSPEPAALETLLQLRLDAFLDAVACEAHVHEVLEALGGRYALGLLSNYPDGAAIRESLAQCGLEGRFQSVVVSGDVGFVKPHPLVFACSLQELGVHPAEVLFVGDNWLADVQGAKRAGMRVAHMRRWAPPEHFEAAPDDHAPDAVIQHLEELPALLGL